jgi:putative endonuclease
VHNDVLYIGVTSDLFTRIPEHKNKVYVTAFTAKYNCNKLVYYETYGRIEDAIAREKQLKKWNRQWKIDLIKKMNPEWEDLFENL